MKKPIKYCLEINEKLMYASLKWEISKFHSGLWESKNCESVSNIIWRTTGKNDKNMSQPFWKAVPNGYNKCENVVTVWWHKILNTVFKGQGTFLNQCIIHLRECFCQWLRGKLVSFSWFKNLYCRVRVVLYEPINRTSNYLGGHSPWSSWQIFRDLHNHICLLRFVTLKTNKNNKGKTIAQSLEYQWWKSPGGLGGK